MNQISTTWIINQARAEHRAECERAAIEAEKERLRAIKNQSFWQWLISKLPFTITRK
jgi:hypothetical protein